MEGLKHRFLWLQVANGAVQVEPGPAIVAPARFAVDPELHRHEWRQALELLAQAFAEGGTCDVLERIDRSVNVTARPGLTGRPMQIIDLDNAGGGLRVLCSMGEIATFSRVNLIIDAHHFATGGDHVRVSGARRLQQLLDGFTRWLINAPDPLPNVQPSVKNTRWPDPLAQRVAALETRVDEALSMPPASRARH